MVGHFGESSLLAMQRSKQANTFDDRTLPVLFLEVQFSIVEDVQKWQAYFLISPWYHNVISVKLSTYVLLW